MCDDAFVTVTSYEFRVFLRCVGLARGFEEEELGQSCKESCRRTI